MGHPARYIPNHPVVVDEMIDGEVVVIDLSTGSYFSLVDSAAVIWAVLPAAPTAAEVAGHLGQVYDASGNDVVALAEAFLAALVAEGLVAEVDGEDGTGVAVELPVIAAGTPLGEPRLEKFDDMQHLILLDPVHEIDETMGWPRIRAAE